MKLTCTSLNVQGFFNWEERQTAISHYLQQTAPDIVMFQEVTFLPQIATDNQVALLNKTLHYPYENSAVTRLQTSPHYENYREGLGVISRWPIIKSETIILKQNPQDEHQRIVQLIDIRRQDEIIKLANVHFSISDKDENFPRDHLRELLDILASRDETRIIGGDFNMSNLDLHVDLWQETYIASSTTPYITFPEHNKRVDYFLLPKEYAFLNIGTSPDGLSDHRALNVTLSDTTAPPITMAATHQTATL